MLLKNLMILCLALFIANQATAQDSGGDQRHFCERYAKRSLTKAVQVDGFQDWYGSTGIWTRAEVMNYDDAGKRKVVKEDPTNITFSELSDITRDIIIAELKSDFEVLVQNNNSSDRTALKQGPLIEVRVVATVRPSTCGDGTMGKMLSVAGRANFTRPFKLVGLFRPEASLICPMKSAQSDQIKEVLTNLLNANVFPHLKKGLCIDWATVEQ